MLGRTCDSAGRFLTDCVELAYRLPGCGRRSSRAWWRGGGPGGSPRPPWPCPWRPPPTSTSRCSGAPPGSPRRSWAGWSRRPGCGTCPRRSRRPWRRRPTSGTSPSTPSSAPSTAPCTSRPTWRSPTPSPWRRPSPRGPSTSPGWGRPTPSTGAARPRWGTWPATSSPSATTTPTTGTDGSTNCHLGCGTETAGSKPVTQIVLYAHLSADAITHVDQHDGPDGPGEVLCGRIEQANQRLLTVEQIRLWCGRPDVQVVVKQVIDLRERWSAGAMSRPRRSASTSSSATARVCSRGADATPGAATSTTSSPTTTTIPRTAARPPPTTSPRCADATTG